MLPPDESPAPWSASDLGVIAEQEPTMADELRRAADEVEPPCRVISIYPKSAVLGGSLHGRAHPPVKTVS